MRRLLLKLFRRHRLEDDLEMELAFHREQAAARGNPIPLGSTLRIKDATRDVWRFAVLEDLWRDVQYAARSLVRQPAFSVFAVLALVVGIGLNTAVFTAFNAMALRPWAVPDPDRIAIVRGDSFSLSDYRHIRDHARSFEGVALVASLFQVSLEGQERSVDAASGNYFDLLGVPMALGRPFRAAEDRTEAPEPVVVLAHRFWTSQYGGDAGILGRQVRLNGVPFTVIGVVNRQFTGTFQSDVWVPTAARALLDPEERDGALDPDSRCCELVARLAKGVTRTEAEAELAVIAHQLHAPVPGLPQPREPVTLIGTRLVDLAGWVLLSPFLIAQLAVGAILLLACANVGNLILARSIARQRELALRMSLGAGRSRLVRQLVVEGGLLAVVAIAVIFVILPGWARVARLRSDAMSVDAATGVAVTTVVPSIDPGVLAYAAGVAVLATLVCGLAPALQATRAGLMNAMKRQSPQATPHLPLRGVLLSVQVAISVAVLVCAALLLRGLQRASNVDVGFRSHGVSSVWVQVHWKDYSERGNRGLVDRLRDELRPFDRIGVADQAPFATWQRTTLVLPPQGGRPQQSGTVVEAVVDGGYFDVLGIPIVAGRNFMPQDRTRDVVVVNEAFARRYWPRENPLGQTIQLPVRRDGSAILWNGAGAASTADERGHEVVGLSRDAHLDGPTDVVPMVFRVHSEQDQTFTLLVPDRSVGMATAAIRRLDAGVSVRVSKLGDRLDGELAAAAMLAGLASGLGFIALVLATTGVYGVIAYAVEGRRREIGIRMALGARARTVISVVIGRNARALLTGLAAGLALSMLASRVLESQLFGVSRLDPGAFAGVLLVLVVAGIAASALPARRATRINPVKVLHAD